MTFMVECYSHVMHISSMVTEELIDERSTWDAFRAALPVGIVSVSRLLPIRAWEAFRPRGNEVNWFRIVWFPHSIPRHSFHLWLVMRNSLKTQDKLRQWDVGINTDLNLLRCSLCNTQSDSHAHLFFECPYSSKVWKLVRHLADMELVPPILYDIVAHLQSMANKRTARSIFGKLILAASSYFVWLERNNRLFKNVKRTPEELRDVIMVTVRLKLLSFKFKNSAKDALERHMLGSEYGEQDRKAAVLYEYETFKATEGELLLDTYIRYL
ncbi:homeodomain-like protein [Tanacetum coccineum]